MYIDNIMAHDNDPLFSDLTLEGELYIESPSNLNTIM